MRPVLYSIDTVKGWRRSSLLQGYAYNDKHSSRLPPSLLIASTRDQALSSVAYMHSRLIA